MSTPQTPDAPQGIPALIERIMKLKPVRVFTNYSSSGGPLMAAGMSYQAVFAIFAAIFVGFSIFGIALKSNPDLQTALIAQLNTSVPGLIGKNGAIDPEALLDTPVFGWTGAIAGVGLLATAIGWLASTRDAVRRIFDLPGVTTFFLLLKLKDLGLAIGLAVVLVISAAMSVASSTATGFLFDLLGWDSDSDGGRTVVHIVGLLLVFAFDTFVLASVFRILAGVPIPRPQLLQGAAIGGAALGVLKVLGSALLGGATSNPLLASFAVIIGILIWFNLVCQVILVSASWIAVSLADSGVEVHGWSVDEAEQKARETALDAERRLLEAQRARLAAEVPDAHGLRRRRLDREIARIDKDLDSPPVGQPTDHSASVSGSR